jgi:hypothetical protein
MEHVIFLSRIFVDRLRGTGKTFLYGLLLAKIGSMNLIVVATASSSIATSIMSGGRSPLKEIPIKLGENSVGNFSKQSAMTALLRRTTLIIWDELTMTKRTIVVALWWKCCCVWR